MCILLPSLATMIRVKRADKPSNAHESELAENNEMPSSILRPK